MKLPEITEDTDEEIGPFIDAKARRERIRKIIEHQKSLYLASTSTPCSSSYSDNSSARSSSLPSLAPKSKSLFNLMRSGSTSLRRLFNMEHTSLANYFEDYSGSPVIKPIFLWGSDAENEMPDPWAFLEHFRPAIDTRIHEVGQFSSNFSFINEDFGFGSCNRQVRIQNHKLTRKKSYKILPRFGLWICRGFRFRFRLRRKLRILTCKRK